MSDDLTPDDVLEVTTAVETPTGPLYRTLVPLERYDLVDGVARRDERGRRVKLPIPVGTETDIDGLALVELGQAVPINAQAVAACEAIGLTEAVIQRRIAERKSMDRAISSGRFAQLQAAQQ